MKTEPKPIQPHQHGLRQLQMMQIVFSNTIEIIRIHVKSLLQRLQHATRHWIQTMSVSTGWSQTWAKNYAAIDGPTCPPQVKSTKKENIARWRLYPLCSAVSPDISARLLRKVCMNNNSYLLDISWNHISQLNASLIFLDSCESLRRWDD